MSTSLTTRTTLALIPLATGIQLRHVYDKVLQLMNDEAFTITRMSPSLLPVCLNPQSIQSSPAMLNRILWARQRSSRTVEELQQFANLRTPVGVLIRRRAPHRSAVLLCRGRAVLVRALGREHGAQHMVGGLRWWRVRPGDVRLDTERVTDKRDMKEAKRCEKAAGTVERTQSPGESACPQYRRRHCHRQTPSRSAPKRTGKTRGRARERRDSGAAPQEHIAERPELSDAILNDVVSGSSLKLEG
ncbi:hypothetical protein V8E53_004472 [Lactarius tabidus]